MPLAHPPRCLVVSRYAHQRCSRSPHRCATIQSKIGFQTSLSASVARVPKVRHALVVGLELDSEFGDVGARRQRGRVVAVGSESTGGPNIENGNRDLLEMAVKGYVDSAKQRVDIPI